ncbi:aldolase [Verminephrobacter aporrectodeae subsp. tuberculatae]|uniref:class I fructose-bisphosphate aldolase n=1 Tax=Verminephrobacter aporrectodeae TaxID=1110389 RepID=UPI00223773CA|nr:aldolase [Verminephrobacter aporrectodeae]MCW5257668.1 aldolase [Verminephrobacter aporrectodeae subsp. tuberculatae]
MEKKEARLNRMLNAGRCLDIALDHGVCNEPDFLAGLQDMPVVMDQLVAAGPDAIQLNYGQADLLQRRSGRDKPALVLRLDMGNPYNATRHRVMWALLQNQDDPVLPAVQMDAACAVLNLFMLPDEPDLLRQCVLNIARVRADCERYGMPLMIEPLVMSPHTARGGYMVDGDAGKIVTLVRLAREMGADVVKADPTADPAEFHRVVQAARCPVLVRGGGKEDLQQVFARSRELLDQGAAGMVYGRNVYQHRNPKGVVRALMAMVHENASAERAWQLYGADAS